MHLTVDASSFGVLQGASQYIAGRCCKACTLQGTADRQHEALLKSLPSAKRCGPAAACTCV
jgi:hypothetical protein